MKARSWLSILFMMLLLPAGAAVSAASGEVPLMTTDELKALIDNPDVIVLDVRRGKDLELVRIQDQGGRPCRSRRLQELGRRLSQGEKDRALLCLTQRGHQCRSGTSDDKGWLQRCVRVERRLARMVPVQVSGARKIGPNRRKPPPPIRSAAAVFGSAATERDRPPTPLQAKSSVDFKAYAY